MASSDHASNWEREVDILQRLQLAYEERGYTFQANPSHEALPSFLSNYRPDAIAVKGDEKVIIEVKSRKTRASEFLLSELQKRISQEKDWRLDVVYASMSPEDSLNISIPQLERINQQLKEIEELTTKGHVRAAFILSWSLLEAALNRLNADEINHARNPGQVVQALATRGFLDRGAEQILRQLAQLRNRIVHGDLDANAEQKDVAQVLNAVQQTLVKNPL